jgi:FkbM family methyltransferase
MVKFLPKYFSLNGIDFKLKKYLDYSNGYFVELGANDGVRQSNTKYFEQFRKWTGTLIEPMPLNYEECKRNRSKKTKVYNFACVSFEYKKPFTHMIYSNLMSVALDGESDIENRMEHAQIGAQFLSEKQKMYEFDAPARTLNSILSEADAPKLIDLLSLDVEGAEIEVLKGVDHQEYRFKYIVIEIREFEKMNHYLNKCGYIFIENLSSHDYLFKNTQELSDI